MAKPNPEPVNSLQTLGEADWQEWVDYKALGFNQAHIPDLLRMATDKELILEAMEPEFWGPIPAGRAMAQREKTEQEAIRQKQLAKKEEGKKKRQKKSRKRDWRG